METQSKKPIDTKIGVKPVFSSLIHRDAKEGPCRVGTAEELSPRREREKAREHFSNLREVLKRTLAGNAEILDPVYIEYGEDFIIPAKELAKLEDDLDRVDLFLLANYRVPGIERFGKPVAMVGGGVTNVDVAAYLRARGIEGYAPLDVKELNQLVKSLSVRKAIEKTRFLIIADEEILPVGVVSSIWDLEALRRRFGILSKRLSFSTFWAEMSKAEEETELIDEVTERLVIGADHLHMTEDDVRRSVVHYLAAKSLMKRYDCNAFAFPCFRACATKVPADRRFTPCLTHTLLKDEGFPSSCEGDLNALLAMTVLMYVSKEAAFMGNPYLGSSEDNVLSVTHDVPGLKMKGLGKPSLPYEIRNFTKGGWGVTIRYDFSKDKGETVTLGRFNPMATRMLVTTGEIVGGSGFESISCSLTVHIKVSDVRRLIHRQADYGHHLAMVYGNHVDELRRVAEIMDWEIEVA